MSPHSPINFYRCFIYPLVLVQGVFLLQGCTISRTLSATTDCDYKRIRLQKWRQDSAKESGTIRVLLVHGMNNHPFGLEAGKPELDGCPTYEALQHKLSGNLTPDDRTRLRSKAVTSQFDYFITTLAAKLEVGKEATPDPEDFTVIHASGNDLALGYMFTRSFGASGRRHRALKFYVVNWGLAASVIKERQFGGWETNAMNLKGDRDFDRKLDKHRARINKSLKWNTIDWGLGDAALYLSPAGETFQQVVTDGIRRLQRETNPSDRIAIVSASLGSTIVLDTIPTLVRSDQTKPLFTEPDESAAREEVPGERGTPARVVFYMFANQFALLTVGRTRNEPVNPLIQLDNALKDARAEATVQIYAFTDPNDLLSLPLNTKLEKVSICNVYVRNPGFTVGLFMHPGDAHVNYEKNDHVIGSLLNGPEKNPIKPVNCP